MEREGVQIDRTTMVHGADCIKIGLRTRIGPDVVVAAGKSVFSRSFDAPGSGKIVLGERCSVRKGSILVNYGGEIEIGDDVSINPYCVLYGFGGLKIGAKSRIAANVVVVPMNHNYLDKRAPIMNQGVSAKGIQIGTDVWIGTGARVLDGVEIGDGAVVGAGAVVTKNVAAGAVVVGMPARQIGQRD